MKITQQEPVTRTYCDICGQEISSSETSYGYKHGEEQLDVCTKRLAERGFGHLSCKELAESLVAVSSARKALNEKTKKLGKTIAELKAACRR